MSNTSCYKYFMHCDCVAIFLVAPLISLIWYVMRCLVFSPAAFKRSVLSSIILSFFHTEESVSRDSGLLAKEGDLSCQMSDLPSHA